MECLNCLIDNSICIFDSGIGGINVLSECVRRKPWLNYNYVSDNFNVPYGNKSSAEIFNLVKNKLDVVAKSKPRAVVIACNTATTNCIGALRKEYDFNLVGIEPAVKQCRDVDKKCLLLCTSATANSKNLGNLIKKFGANLEVLAMKNLAEYIENNAPNLDENAIINSLPNGEYDVVILGCTHYVFAKKMIRKKYNCAVFDGIVGTVNHLFNILGICDHKSTKMGKVGFFGGNIAKNQSLFKFVAFQNNT